MKRCRFDGLVVLALEFARDPGLGVIPTPAPTSTVAPALIPVVTFEMSEKVLTSRPLDAAITFSAAPISPLT